MKYINELINKVKTADVIHKLYWIRNVRLFFIIIQMIQSLLHIKIIPTMICGFIIAAMSLIDIKFTEDVYKQKQYTMNNRIIMQIVNIMIILMIWLG